MRRDEIDLTVEYCETGPLAYGAEPRVTPNQLRFLSLEPYTWVHTWVVEEYETTVRGETVKRKKPVETGQPVARPVQQAKIEAHVPYSQRFSFASNQPHGAAFSTWDQSVKGHLLAERKRGDTWHQGLAQPASVHRTWSAHLAVKGEVDAARYKASVKQAPARLRSAVRESIENAVLILENLPAGGAKVSQEDIVTYIMAEVQLQTAREG